MIFRLCLRRNTENETFVFEISEEQKIFGIVIDNELTMLRIHAKSLAKELSFSKTI